MTKRARDMIAEFFDGLNEDEAIRLLRRLRRFTVQGPFTQSDYIALVGEPQQEREYSPEEKQRLDAHADALAALERARAAYEAALGELRVAENKAHEGIDGRRRRSAEQQREVDRLAEIADERREAWEEAKVAEVAARPHQPARRRAGRRFPLAGRILRAGKEA